MSLYTSLKSQQQIDGKNYRMHVLLNYWRTKIFPIASTSCWKWVRCPFPTENCRLGTCSCQFGLCAMCRAVASLGVKVRIPISFPPSRKISPKVNLYPVSNPSSVLIWVLILICPNGFPLFNSAYLLPDSM